MRNDLYKKKKNFNIYGSIFFCKKKKKKANSPDYIINTSVCKDFFQNLIDECLIKSISTPHCFMRVRINFPISRC